MFAACTRRQPVDEDGAAAVLMRNLVAAGTVDVIAADDAIEARCAAIAARAPLAGEPRPNVVATAELGRAGNARTVIGTASDPPVVGLVAHAGVDFPRPACFRVLGQHFTDPADTLIATFEDPERPGLPVSVFLGNDVRALARDVREPLFGWRPELRVFHRGELALRVPLTRAGRPRVERVVRPGPERAQLRREYVALPFNPAGMGGERSPDVADARALAYVEACSRAAGRTSLWTSPGKAAQPVALVLHAHLEELAAWTGSRELAWSNPHDDTVHALLASDVLDDAGAELALVVARRALGEPVEPWMSDAARYAGASAFDGVELERWVAHLGRAELVPSVREIVDARSPHSPLLVRPLRAALWRALIEARGDDHARQLWSGTLRFHADAAADELLAGWVARCVALHPAEARARDPFERWSAGLWIEEPAWVDRQARDGGGYGTRACDASLAAAARAGADVVVLSSSAIASSDVPADAGSGLRERATTLEGDLALLCAAGDARRLGLRAWLAPQLLSAPAGTWSGSWLRGERDEWRAFFEEYRRFAVHQGLLAELGGFELASLGADLPETARLVVHGRRGQPAEVEWKREGWTDVVRAARGAFRGAWTWIAASEEEARDFGHWSALDAVAIEPRLSLRARGFVAREVSMAQALDALRRSTSAGARIAREEQKPLVLVGASFARAGDVRTPRMGPGSIDSGSRDEPFERLSQLVPLTSDVLRAVVVGRWSTDARDRGLGPRDHLLDGEEEAARVIAKLRAAAQAR